MLCSVSAVYDPLPSLPQLDLVHAAGVWPSFLSHHELPVPQLLRCALSA